MPTIKPTNVPIAEDRPRGGYVGLEICARSSSSLRLGQNGDARRHCRDDRLLHDHRVAPRNSPDDPEFDIGRTAMRIGQQFREGTISDYHRAIVLEVRADGKAPDDFGLAAV